MKALTENFCRSQFVFTNIKESQSLPLDISPKGAILAASGTSKIVKVKPDRNYLEKRCSHGDFRSHRQLPAKLPGRDGGRRAGGPAGRAGPAVQLRAQPDQLRHVHPLLPRAGLYRGEPPGRQRLYPHHPGPGGPGDAFDARHQLPGGPGGPALRPGHPQQPDGGRGPGGEPGPHPAGRRGGQGPGGRAPRSPGPGPGGCPEKRPDSPGLGIHRIA